MAVKNLAGATDVWDVCTNVNLRHRWDIMVRQFSRACKDFLTINDWYNGANIVNLPLAVVEIWFVLNIKHWLPVWTGSKSQIGVTFLNFFFTINDQYNGAKSFNLPLAVVEIWFL